MRARVAVSLLFVQLGCNTNDYIVNRPVFDEARRRAAANVEPFMGGDRREIAVPAVRNSEGAKGVFLSADYLPVDRRRSATVTINRRNAVMGVVGAVALVPAA